MSFVGSNILAGASGQGGGGYEIERSLRFNSGDSSFLNRTPSSAGNRKKFTWSGWIKKHGVGTQSFILSAGTSSDEYVQVYFSTDQLIINTKVSGQSVTSTKTGALYRDPSSWFHLIIAIDTTATGNSGKDRLKLYVNGNLLDDSAYSTDGRANIAVNSNLAVNATVAHYIGKQGVANTYANVSLAEVNFIDGQALDSSSFGETDSSGVWQPKEFDGTYTGATTYPSQTSSLSQTGWDTAQQANIWDNNESTRASGYNNNQIGTVTFSPALTGVYKVEVKQQNYNHFLNGTQITPSGTNGSYYILHDGDPITLNSCGNAYYGNTQTVDIFAIKVNGQLVDSQSWTLASHSVATGANSYYLPFTDNSSSAALGIDTSGVSPANTWTVNNLSVAAGAGNDSLRDSPTNGTPSTGGDLGGVTVGNYATLNPLDKEDTSLALTNGNLQVNKASGNTWKIIRSSMRMDSGAWYWEVQALDSGSNSIIGVCTFDTNTSFIGGTYQDRVLYPGTGEIWGIAYDADNGTLAYYKNGAIQSSFSETGIPQVGLFAAASLYGPYVTSNPGFIFNFGQRAFAYTAPSGFKSLNTANLPTPTIADGSQYFDTKLYQGTGSTQALTMANSELSPDFVWIKQRNTTRDNVLIDSVRGVNKILYSNEAVGEAPYSNLLNSFDSNGFTLGGNQLSNENNGSYAAWVWDAGSSNTTIAASSLNSSSYNQSQSWSNNITTTGNSGNWQNKTNMFDANIINYAHANADGSGAATVTLTFSPAVTCTSNITFFGGITSFNPGSISINGGTAVALTPCATINPAAADATVVPFSGSITSIVVTKTSSTAAGLLIYGWKVDNKRLIDYGVTPANLPSIASTVRANPSAGFSIISYAGNATVGTTFGHGLNAAPEFAIFKNRDDSLNWYAYHKDIGNTKYLRLNGTIAATTRAEFLNNTSPTSSVITLGNDAEINATGQDIICYAFAPVEGYSAMGKYVGNGSTDGSFVFTGFRPAFVLLKCSSAASTYWTIQDDKRLGYNPDQDLLFPNATDSENSTSYMDFLSNGFKLRATSGFANGSGATYIYLAFASNPFASNGGLAR